LQCKHHPPPHFRRHRRGCFANLMARHTDAAQPTEKCPVATRHHLWIALVGPDPGAPHSGKGSPVIGERRYIIRCLCKGEVEEVWRHPRYVTRNAWNLVFRCVIGAIGKGNDALT